MNKETFMPADFAAAYGISESDAAAVVSEQVPCTMLNVAHKKLQNSGYSLAPGWRLDDAGYMIAPATKEHRVMIPLSLDVALLDAIKMHCGNMSASAFVETSLINWFDDEERSLDDAKQCPAVGLRGATSINLSQSTALKLKEFCAGRRIRSVVITAALCKKIYSTA